MEELDYFDQLSSTIQLSSQLQMKSRAALDVLDFEQDIRESLRWGRDMLKRAQTTMNPFSLRSIINELSLRLLEQTDLLRLGQEEHRQILFKLHRTAQQNIILRQQQNRLHQLRAKLKDKEDRLEGLEAMMDSFLLLYEEERKHVLMLATQPNVAEEQIANMRIREKYILAEAHRKQSLLLERLANLERENWELRRDSLISRLGGSNSISTDLLASLPKYGRGKGSSEGSGNESFNSLTTLAVVSDCPAGEVRGMSADAPMVLSIKMGESAGDGDVPKEPPPKETMTDSEDLSWKSRKPIIKRIFRSKSLYS